MDDLNRFAIPLSIFYDGCQQTVIGTHEILSVEVGRDWAPLCAHARVHDEYVNSTLRKVRVRPPD